MHYLLFYEKVPDHAAREKPFAEEHVAHVMGAIASGDIILAGSLLDPDDGAALMVFESDSAAIAELFAAADPYVRNGVIARWYVRAWQTI